MCIYRIKKKWKKLKIVSLMSRILVFVCVVFYKDYCKCHRHDFPIFNVLSYWWCSILINLSLKLGKKNPPLLITSLWEKTPRHFRILSYNFRSERKIAGIVSFVPREPIAQQKWCTCLYKCLLKLRELLNTPRSQIWADVFNYPHHHPCGRYIDVDYVDVHREA